jgi:hypothetical protein
MWDILRDRRPTARAAILLFHWELLHPEEHFDGGNGAHPYADEQRDARVQSRAVGDVGPDQGRFLVVTI